MQINRKDLDDLQKEVASKLKTGSVPQLLDFLKEEIQCLLCEIPEAGQGLYERYYPQIEQILESSSKPLTEEQKEKVTGVISQVVIVLGMYLNSSKENSKT